MEMIIVKSKVKEIAEGCNVSGDFAEGLNKVALNEVKAASKRAEANGRKTVQGRDVFLGKISGKAMLVVKSKVKNTLNNMNLSSDFSEALNELLIWKVKQAALRAEANGRKTVSLRDL